MTPTLKPTPQQFAAICYLVLMDHHGDGYGEAHPAYAGEKARIVGMGYDAAGPLDSENQAKVVQHLRRWGYELPEEVLEYAPLMGLGI